MANGYAGIAKGIVAGAIAGFLTLVLAYFQHSITYSSMPLRLPSIVMYAVIFDVFGLAILLAGTLGGFVAIYLMSGDRPTRSLYRSVLVSGIVICVINFVVTRQIDYYEPAQFFRIFPGFSLFDVLYFVELMGFSLAGGALGLAFFKGTRRISTGGWRKSVIAGIAAAAALSIANFLPLAMTDFNMFRGNNFQILFYNFTINALIVSIGLFTGIAVAKLIGQSVSSPLHFVLCAGLAGSLAGLFSALSKIIYYFTVGRVYTPSMLDVNYLLYFTLQVMDSVILFMMLAIGGSVIFSYFSGEPKPVPTKTRGVTN